MKTKLMYLLRFTLAYTHAEIKGLIVLLGMMVIYALLYIGCLLYTSDAADE